MLNFYKCLLLNRIASVSKIFPTIMLYKMWEEGKVTSLDDPLERYAQNFVIKNPLGRLKESEQRYTADGLIFLEKGSMPLKPSPVTLRRMASQLSGETTLLPACPLPTTMPLERDHRERTDHMPGIKRIAVEAISQCGPCTFTLPRGQAGPLEASCQQLHEVLKGNSC